MGRRTAFRYTLIFLLIPSLVLATPPSRTKTYVSGTAINPSHVTENEDNFFRYLQSGVDTIADSSVVSADILDSTITTSDILDGTITSSDILDGTIADSKLAQITTASKVSSTAITGGVVLPSGALFYMITGSCPTGTTDVTSTYSDKFIRVNATQGSTGGSDSLSITEANLPSHTHTGPSHNHGLSAATIANESAHTHSVGVSASHLPQGSGSGTISSGSTATGAGSAHTHTLSGNTDSGGTGATGAVGSGTTATITNPYVTAKMCQVN